MQTNLHQAAHACLSCSGLEAKLSLATSLWEDFQAGRLEVAACELPEVGIPGRPPRPELVAPSRVPRRRIGTPEGHAALVHAVAHIEFNAINLACDAAWRFQGLPAAYYGDWLKVAAEEAHHFSLLRDRLRALGHDYGDFPAHDGLWELARKTADDPLRRMALVPRVMEARGLDVTPGMIRRFEQIGDSRTVAALRVILRDEVGHVEAGSRWFQYLCAQRGLDPEQHYFELLQAEFGGRMRCPLHREARLRAGFSERELARLEAMCKPPLRGRD
jgi:uncharacterized ferritin-like protein (DUF455 family)